MKVDAVIPAYKPGHDLRELVEKLLDQTVRLGRIIIINTDREYFDEKEYLIAPAVEVVHITRHEFDHAGSFNIKTFKYLRMIGLRYTEVKITSVILSACIIMGMIHKCVRAIRNSISRIQCSCCVGHIFIKYRRSLKSTKAAVN